MASALILSCNKDDDNITKEDENVDVSKVYLPSKMISGEYNTYFTYNILGLLTKVEETDGFVYNFKYSGKQLVEVTVNDGSITTVYTFTQTSSKVSLQMKAEINGRQETDNVELILDGNGNIIDDGYFTYKYDSKGNVIEMANEDEKIDNINYDSHNGIFKNLNLPKWVVHYILDYQPNMVNNMTSVEFISVEDPEDNSSVKIKYEYNSDNYPTKMIVNTDDSDEFIQTIEYTKK